MDSVRDKGEAGEAEKPAVPINDSPVMGQTSTGTPTISGPHPPPSPLSGCYLLLVLPEPHIAQHKDLILNQVAKGFLSWDKDNCHVDLEKELQALVTQAPEGEEARNGERLIQYATENLVTEVLIHPQSNTLLQCIRNLLASFTKHRHIIHAGYTFGENGSWILQDGTFSLADLLDAFNEHDVQRVLRAYENSVTVDINCAGIGEWSTQRLTKEPCTRTCKIRLNPDDVLTADTPAITSFTNYIEQYLVPQTLDQLMQPSEVVGNIRFSHPTLYVFPGGQGDAALFGINGFNMLVDGGFARKACFWDFTRHLDRLDAVLLTRLNNSNVAGMSSVLAKKRDMQVYPQIGHFFCNLVERKNLNSPDGDKNQDPLVLSLTKLGQDMMLNLKHINLRPHSCYRDTEPINLYHKVGHGTLDMYVLSPSKDSREVREFLSKWNSGDWKVFSGSHKKDNSLNFPIQNMISICALLIWQPANPEDTITRILFPGSTPQSKIFEGMERLRHLEFLKHPTCSAKTISPSVSLIALKDKTVKQKMTLIDRETKRAVEIKKQKREVKIETDKADKHDNKSVKKNIVVEEKRINADTNIENKTTKTITEMKECRDIKKIDKEIKKVTVDTSKADRIKEMKEINKIKVEKKKDDSSKDLPMRFITGKTGKTEVISEKKIKEKSPPSKKEPRTNGISSRTDQLKSANTVSKTTPKTSATKPLPAAPKSTKDANNRKVVEQKKIERMSIAASATKSSTTKSKASPPSAPVTSEKKPVPRRPRPAGSTTTGATATTGASASPSKTRSLGESPVKSAKSISIKPDKDGALRKIKLEKETADSSTVSTPSAIEVDSIAKFAEKCLTEKSEDMSLDSIESKVLADLKEERQVVAEIEAVLQKAERIQVAEKIDRLEGEDEMTGEITGEITGEKKDLTEDMTEDDVTADIDEIPRKSPMRISSQGPLTEDDDEYLIIEREEVYTEDSVQSGEHEHKHFLDAVESEKEKIKDIIATKKDREFEEDSEESEGDEEEESGGEEKEVAEEKGITEDREKHDDDISENKLPVGEFHEKKTDTKVKSPIAEYKEQLKEEMKDIIMSAAEIIQKTEDKDDSGKKDSDDLKEISSLSPDKLDSSEKKTDTDIKPEIDQKIKEKLEESQEKISTVESGQTTTAPTLPEDERIPLDVIKPATIEKQVIDDKKIEISKPKDVAPLTTGPIEIKPDTRAFNIRQGAQVLQRDIVKTPDEVADLPVHEEVDPNFYKMQEFEERKDEKSSPSSTTEAKVVKDIEKEKEIKKDEKSDLGFFGKIADKFEKELDKLTNRNQKDLGKDIDDNVVLKPGSNEEPATKTFAEKDKPLIADDHKIEKSMIKEESLQKSPDEVLSHLKIEEKMTNIGEKIKDAVEEVEKIADGIEDNEDVEALLEEASKKFKTVKDSLHDSLESLEEKLAEAEFNRATKEFGESLQDEVKGTLDEVVGKLEEIQSYSDGSKKVETAVISKDKEAESTDIPFKDVREAVRDVGEVLAGTAGIIIDDKPKDVVEIVKKVAEVLKEDDFLSDKVLFEKKENIEIEKSIDKASLGKLEVHEELCMKKIISTEPILTSPVDNESNKAAAKRICEDLMEEEDFPQEFTSVKRTFDNLKSDNSEIDVLKAGIEEVCHKVELPEPQYEKQTTSEIHQSEITFDHKSSPTIAELVIVSPDSQPSSPKFTSDKFQSKSDEKDEIETVISQYEDITQIIEELVFVRNKKITMEIVDYIRVIKRIPREQVIYIIEEIILRKKVPQSSIVHDGVLQDKVDNKKELKESFDDSIVSEELKTEIESEIVNNYITKGTKLTKSVIEDIHMHRKIPIRIVIEIIEKIVIIRKIRRQSIVDIADDVWNSLKSSSDLDKEPEENEDAIKQEEIDTSTITELVKSLIEEEIINDYISKGKKLTRSTIEDIHARSKLPRKIIIEIIETITMIRKISRNTVIDIPEGEWNELKYSEESLDETEIEDKELLDGYVQILSKDAIENVHSEIEKPDDFEAVEQEYKVIGSTVDSLKKEKIDIEESVESCISDAVIEANEKVIDINDLKEENIHLDKSPSLVATDEKFVKPEEKKLTDSSLVDKQPHETEVIKDTEKESDNEENEASIVRRMIVTATSEDGGEETEVCPTGSITFAKSITPDDSLRTSPVKTTPDKDSLRSVESTPEKDSLEKNLSSAQDSKTLDDSIDIVKKSSLENEKSGHDLSSQTADKNSVDNIDKLDDSSLLGSADNASAHAPNLQNNGTSQLPLEEPLQKKILEEEGTMSGDEDKLSKSPSIEVAHLDKIKPSSSNTSLDREEQKQGISEMLDKTKINEDSTDQKDKKKGDDDDDKAPTVPSSSDRKYSVKESLHEIETEKSIEPKIDVGADGEVEDKKVKEIEKAIDKESSIIRKESLVDHDHIIELENIKGASNDKDKSLLDINKEGSDNGTHVTESAELLSQISDKVLPVKISDEITLEKGTPSPVAESVKSSSSPIDPLPVHKDSLILDKKLDTFDETKTNDSKIDDDKTTPKSPITDNKQTLASPQQISPAHDKSIFEGEMSGRKLSNGHIAKQIDDAKLNEFESLASSQDSLPIQVQSLIPDKLNDTLESVEEKKIQSTAVESVPTPVVLSRDNSPHRKSSLLLDASMPSGQSAQQSSDGKSPSPISENIKSASPHDISPVRKNSLINDEILPHSDIPQQPSVLELNKVHTDEKSSVSIADSMKNLAPSQESLPVHASDSISTGEKEQSSAITVGEIRSLASSRDISPVPTDNIAQIVKESFDEETVDNQLSLGELKESASSQNVLEIEKEDSVPDVKDKTSDKVEITTVDKDSSLSTKLIDKPEKMSDKELVDETIPTSLVRKESVTEDVSKDQKVDIKLSDSIAKHNETSPMSATLEESIKLEKDTSMVDEKTPNVVHESVKESEISQEISAVRKESFVDHDKTISMSQIPRQSIDIETVEKTQSSVIDHAKFLSSPSEIHSIAQESLSNDEKISPRQSVDLEIGDSHIERKTPSPILEIGKLSPLPCDISPDKKESLVHDEPETLSQPSRPSIDLDKVHIDKQKSPSPIIKTAKLPSSPRDISPSRKESLVHDESFSSIPIPRQSIDITLKKTHIEENTSSPTAKSIKSPTLFADTSYKNLAVDQPTQDMPHREEEKINDVHVERKSPSPIIESVKTAASSRDISPASERSQILKETISSQADVTKSPSSITETIKLAEHPLDNVSIAATDDHKSSVAASRDVSPGLEDKEKTATAIHEGDEKYIASRSRSSSMASEISHDKHEDKVFEKVGTPLKHDESEGKSQDRADEKETASRSRSSSVSSEFGHGVHKEKEKALDQSNVESTIEISTSMIIDETKVKIKTPTKDEQDGYEKEKELASRSRSSSVASEFSHGIHKEKMESKIDMSASMVTDDLKEILKTPSKSEPDTHEKEKEPASRSRSSSMASEFSHDLHREEMEKNIDMSASIVFDDSKGNMKAQSIVEQGTHEKEKDITSRSRSSSVASEFSQDIHKNKIELNIDMSTSLVSDDLKEKLKTPSKVEPDTHEKEKELASRSRTSSIASEYSHDLQKEKIESNVDMSTSMVLDDSKTQSKMQHDAHEKEKELASRSRSSSMASEFSHDIHKETIETNIDMSTSLVSDDLKEKLKTPSKVEPDIHEKEKELASRSRSSSIASEFSHEIHKGKIEPNINMSTSIVLDDSKESSKAQSKVEQDSHEKEKELASRSRSSSIASEFSHDINKGKVESSIDMSASMVLDDLKGDSKAQSKVEQDTHEEKKEPATRSRSSSVASEYSYGLQKEKIESNVDMSASIVTDDLKEKLKTPSQVEPDIHEKDLASRSRSSSIASEFSHDIHKGKMEPYIEMSTSIVLDDSKEISKAQSKAEQDSHEKEKELASRSRSSSIASEFSHDINKGKVGSSIDMSASMVLDDLKEDLKAQSKVEQDTHENKKEPATRSRSSSVASEYSHDLQKEKIESNIDMSASMVADDLKEKLKTPSKVEPDIHEKGKDLASRSRSSSIASEFSHDINKGKVESSIDMSASMVLDDLKEDSKAQSKVEQDTHEKKKDPATRSRSSSVASEYSHDLQKEKIESNVDMSASIVTDDLKEKLKTPSQVEPDIQEKDLASRSRSSSIASEFSHDIHKGKMEQNIDLGTSIVLDDLKGSSKAQSKVEQDSHEKEKELASRSRSSSIASEFSHDIHKGKVESSIDMSASMVLDDSKVDLKAQPKIEHGTHKEEKELASRSRSSSMASEFSHDIHKEKIIDESDNESNIDVNMSKVLDKAEGKLKTESEVETKDRETERDVGIRSRSSSMASEFGHDLHKDKVLDKSGTESNIDMSMSTVIDKTEEKLKTPTKVEQDASKEEKDHASRSRSSSVASEFSHDVQKEKIADKLDAQSNIDMSMSMAIDKTEKKSETASKIEQDAQEKVKDLSTRSRSSSIASEFSHDIDKEKMSKTSDLTKTESSVSTEQILYEDSENSKTRSRSQSIVDDDIIAKTTHRESSSGLASSHEEHLQQTDTKTEMIEDDFEDTVTSRKDVERYIVSQYVSRKKKITRGTIEEIVALYDVPDYIVIEIIREICDNGRISRESIIDFDLESEDKDQQSEISYVKRVDMENLITNEYIMKNKKITWKIIQEISVLKGIDVNFILEIIEILISQKKIPRETVIDADVYVGQSTQRKSFIINEDNEEDEKEEEEMKKSIRQTITYAETEHGHSGESTPPEYDSAKESLQRHFDDKYESPFHKAFVGGMTEIRTTHITTLSGKSTPDVGMRIDTPDSLLDSGAGDSDRIEKAGTSISETSELDPIVIKRTIVTVVQPGYETTVEKPDSIVTKEIIIPSDNSEYEKIVKTTNPIVIKRTIVRGVDEDDDDSEYDTQRIIKKTIVREILEEDIDDENYDDHKGILKSDMDGKIAQMMSKSLGQSSSGRSSPDKSRDSPVLRSSTATPDSFCSSEVIRTTITKTRTMSGEGEITTTTKEVTETTNERGETIVLAEKIDVKTSVAEPELESSHHHWLEEKHEESEEEDPLSGRSQILHDSKLVDDGKVEFSATEMNSSFYRKLPDIPQPRHSMDRAVDSKDTFTKVTVEKTYEDSDGKITTVSRTYADIDESDVNKLLKEDPEEDDDDSNADKDPLKSWGTPLKLPSPERPDKFNLRSAPILRNSLDISPDSLNFDVINNWGEPLRLPSPAAAVTDEASNKTMPTTPKKDNKKPSRKVITENIKNNKKRSDSPAGKEKKKEQKKIQPVYLDLTYVPHHGNSYYASLEFFKRIRARYYVFSGTEPSREVYDALLDAKKTWENKNLEVTMIPTYDTDTLGYWVADNEDALAANHIDLSPSASRCTINLQDHETSCSAYRLEF